MLWSRRRGARRAEIRKNRPDSSSRRWAEFRASGTLVSLWVAAGFCLATILVMMLRENVVLTSTSGYEGYFSEVLIDIRGGHVLSEKPVRVKMVNGLLNANRLEIVEGGELMRFEGNVVVLMNLGEDKK